MEENSIMIISAIIAVFAIIVLAIGIIVYLFYWRRKQQSVKCCGCECTFTDFGDCCHNFGQHCLSFMGCCGVGYETKQAFQSYTTAIEQQSKEPAEAIDSTELQILNEELLEIDTKLQALNEELLEKDTNDVTPCQPKIPTGPITSTELQTFTQELLEKDAYNVTPMLRINHQGRTNSSDTDDKAPDPLLTIPSAALSGPTIRAFLRLLNNYNPNVTAVEFETEEEIWEQNNFLNEIMKTPVMKHTEKFLNTRCIIQRPLKDILKEIWFTMYSRAGRNDGSSGFEHVFIGEIKDKKVLGFHNWIQFGHEEWDGDLDYKGIMRYIDLGNRGQVIKGRFDWMNERKPVGTLFVGTSPEFEMALYTVCFLVKPDKRCEVKLNNKKINIQTHSLSWNHKLIGAAYPDI